MGFDWLLIGISKGILRFFFFLVLNLKRKQIQTGIFNSSSIPMKNINQTTGDWIIESICLSSIHIHFLQLFSLWIHTPIDPLNKAFCHPGPSVSIGNPVICIFLINSQDKLKYSSKIMKAKCYFDQRDEHPDLRDKKFWNIPGQTEQNGTPGVCRDEQLYGLPTLTRSPLAAQELQHPGIHLFA